MNEVEQDILNFVLELGDQYPIVVWVVRSLSCHDPLAIVFPFNKEIIEAMQLGDRPWKYMHQRASLLPTESDLIIGIDETIKLGSM